PGEVADKSEDPQEYQQLEGVAGRGPRDDLPQQPQHRLREADRPDRAVEIPAFVSLTLRGRLHPRQAPERPEQPDRAGERKVGGAIDLLQIPLPGRDGDDEAGDVEDGKGDDFAPGEGVADAAGE